MISSFVPEELIWAAGILPLRVTRTWDSDISLSTVYRSTSTCSYCNHVLQTFLSDEISFLDGVIAVDKDQDVLRMLKMAEYGGGAASICIMHMPFSPTKTREEYYHTQLITEQEYLEHIAGMPITEKSLDDAIRLYNELRELVRQIYALQKQNIPALTGTELLGLTTGIQVMDRAEAVSEHFCRGLKPAKHPLPTCTPAS